MKFLVSVLALSFLPIMALASDVTICGAFKDNGDTFQIADGKLNPYVDTALEGFEDPQDLVGQVYKLEPWNKTVCATGTVQAYDRGGEIAFIYLSLSGLSVK